MENELKKLLETSQKKKSLPPDAIPDLDLYMDQIIALMQRYLGDGEKEPLTRTMIHNYSKAGLITPIKGKKYTKEQVLQMLSIYHLKKTLSIAQITRVLSAMTQEPEGTLANSFEQQIAWRETLDDQLTKGFEEIMGEYHISADNTQDAFTFLLMLTDISDTFSNFAAQIAMNYFPDPPTKTKKK